ncbi:MAG: hypothetical protein F9K46_11440, partial [Anaerolineae bacterium]
MESTVIKIKGSQYPIYTIEYEVEGTQYRRNWQPNDQRDVDLGDKIPIRYAIDEPDNPVVVPEVIPDRVKTTSAQARVTAIIAAILGFYAVQPVIVVRLLKKFWDRRLSNLAGHIPELLLHLGMSSFLLFLIVLSVVSLVIMVEGITKIPRDDHVVIFAFGSFALISGVLSGVIGWVYLPTLYRTIRNGNNMNFDFFPSPTPDDTKHLNQWRDRGLSYHPGDENKSGGWDHEQWEREIRVPGFDSTKIFEQARARLINFDVVPLGLLEITPQWNIEERLPQPSDLMIQRTHLFKIGNFRLVDVLSAVQIAQIIDEP